MSDDESGNETFTALSFGVGSHTLKGLGQNMRNIAFITRKFPQNSYTRTWYIDGAKAKTQGSLHQLVGFLTWM